MEEWYGTYNNLVAVGDLSDRTSGKLEVTKVGSASSTDTVGLGRSLDVILA